MSLSIVVITKDGGPRIDRLLRWATSKRYVDQILAFVDATTTDDTAQRCSASGVVVEALAITNLDAAFAYAHSPEKVKTDWALHIGDDELMGQWFDEDIERLMQAPYDVYSFPRYNLVFPADGIHPHFGYKSSTYISSRPWYPDFCQRLFRPGYIVHNGEVHEGAQVNGRLAMARPHVFHFDFIDQSRKEREAKWKRYLKQGVVKASRKRGVADDYYRKWCLPEDYEHDVAVCEEEL